MRALIGKLTLARQAGGKTVAKQLFEAVHLRLAKSPIGVSEYLDYGIWHSSVTPERRSEFIGWRTSAELDRLLNNNQSRVLANDKLITHMVMSSGSLPCPQPLATFTVGGRSIGNEIQLTTQDAVVNYLESVDYPFYVKPISAGYGRGVLGVAGKVGKDLVLNDGSRVDMGAFLKPFAFAPYRGMLFQKPLAAHPAIEAVTGTKAVSCVRFICFVTSKGPELHTAFWKITAGKNMLDNFSHGDYGNCLGAINLDTGVIERVIAKMGPGGVITHHPTSGQALTGFALPDWAKAVALVKRASSHFPGLRLQNWDVALCPEGPVLLELNSESELAVPQAISGKGLMDEHLRAILGQIATDNANHRATLSRGVNG
jgi:hypothetical protein